MPGSQSAILYSGFCSDRIPGRLRNVSQPASISRRQPVTAIAANRRKDLLIIPSVLVFKQKPLTVIA